MSLQQVPAGRDFPDDINVIIEVPMNSPAIKYEVDKDAGAMYGLRPELPGHVPNAPLC